jgi:hypothetical protein
MITPSHSGVDQTTLCWRVGDGGQYERAPRVNFVANIAPVSVSSQKIRNEPSGSRAIELYAAPPG